MAQHLGSAWDGAYDVRIGGIGGQRREGSPSSGRAAGRIRNGLTFRRRKFIHRPRSDLGPSLSQADRLTHAIEELLFAVIAPPAPTPIQFEKMRPSTLSERAPFLGDWVECMRR